MWLCSEEGSACLYAIINPINSNLKSHTPPQPGYVTMKSKMRAAPYHYLGKFLAKILQIGQLKEKFPTRRPVTMSLLPHSHLLFQTFLLGLIWDNFKMVSEDMIRMKLEKEQSEHRFESVSYILDLYKGKLIEKLQGKRKLGKLQSEPEILSDFDMPVWNFEIRSMLPQKNFNMIGCLT